MAAPALPRWREWVSSWLGGVHSLKEGGTNQERGSQLLQRVQFCRMAMTPILRGIQTDHWPPLTKPKIQSAKLLHFKMSLHLVHLEYCFFLEDLNRVIYARVGMDWGGSLG